MEQRAFMTHSSLAEGSERRVRLLVLRGGAIGDFILTLPALNALRDRWPQAYLELAGYPHIGHLAVAAGLADRVRSLDEVGMARFFVPHADFSEEQIEWIRSFDIVISYLHDRDELVRANLLRAGARHVVYGSPLVEQGHAADHLARPLQELALYVTNAVPELRLPARRQEEGRAWLQAHALYPRPVAVHPGSGSPRKNWPMDRYAALVDRLVAEKPARPFFIFGEADRELAASLPSRLSTIPVLSDVGLVDVASVLSGVAGYVGNDSGITHLAAAVGAPVTALFGPTDPEQWGPRGSNVDIVRAGDGQWSSIGLDDVLIRLRRPWTGRPA